MKTTERRFDLRTREGKLFLNRVGKAGFAKARREFQRTKPAPVVGAPAQAETAVKPKPFDWSRGICPTLAQLDADIAYREDFLKKLRGLRETMTDAVLAAMMKIAG